MGYCVRRIIANFLRYPVDNEPREAVGRVGGTTSLPCPIINAPNRNEAGIPALNLQDRPIEIVSLFFRFGSYAPKMERNGFQ